jgi:outer membrane protein assembly factor BamD
MAIGRYYENNNQYLAALNRYRGVVDSYQTTSQVPEALYRLVECYVALGLSDEAARDAAVLGYNYPGSHWYEDAYGLLKKASPTVLAKYSVHGAGLVPRLAEPTPDTEPESNGRVGAPGSANEVPEPSAEIMKSASQPTVTAPTDAEKKEDDRDTGLSGAWSDFTKWVKGAL